MGFMDKAKQMAEQAQQKLEETQRQFNEGQAQKGAGGGAESGPGQRFDEHGRPVGDAQPAAEEAPKPPKEGMNTGPDPSRPIE